MPSALGRPVLIDQPFSFPLSQDLTNPPVTVRKPVVPLPEFLIIVVVKPDLPHVFDTFLLLSLETLLVALHIKQLLGEAGPWAHLYKIHDVVLHLLRQWGVQRHLLF